MRETLDQFDPPVVFLITVALLTAASEVGYRLAHNGTDDKKGQVEALLASMLGLLGLLLAFTLSIVEDRFVERSELVVEEANAIETTHLRANLVPEPHATKIKKLLRDYVDVQLSIRVPADVAPAKRKAEELQRALWSEALACAAEHPDSRLVAMFVASVNDLIDVSHKRIAAAFYRRLPSKLLFALYAVALLAYFVQGHNGGLRRSRVPLAAIVVGVSVGLVLTMIVDIDRPWASGIQVNHEPLQSLKETFAAER